MGVGIIKIYHTPSLRGCDYGASIHITTIHVTTIHVFDYMPPPYTLVRGGAIYHSQPTRVDKP